MASIPEPPLVFRQADGQSAAGADEPAAQTQNDLQHKPGFFMPLNPRVTDWRNKRVWIVGASTGIGLALAEALLARGARVAVSARKAEPLQALAAAHPGRALALPLDVLSSEQQYSAWNNLISEWGNADIVVYCAGYYQAMRADQFDLRDALRHDDVNYRGALITLSNVLPAMIAARGGAVALVSSVAGYRGLPNSLAYGPTKAALTHMAEALYMDLQPHGVAVHVINPGFVETPLTAQNRFKMPALITPAQAAEAIIRGFEKGEFEIHFPKRFTRWLKLMRHLPYRWYFALTRRFTGL
jgi:NAD(P)-dependent dehydrogenase (short-subunit alcohol dehydrogenase family)